MRKALIGLAAVAILGVLGFLALTSPSAYRLIRPEPAAAAGRTPDVENGRILFFAGGCTSCHAVRRIRTTSCGSAAAMR